eukprot:Platyproteum_vivax@DN7575_c1_g1_i2.p1
MVVDCTGHIHTFIFAAKFLTTSCNPAATLDSRQLVPYRVWELGVVQTHSSRPLCTFIDYLNNPNVDRASPLCTPFQKLKQVCIWPPQEPNMSRPKCCPVSTRVVYLLHLTKTSFPCTLR